MPEDAARALSKGARCGGILSAENGPSTRSPTGSPVELATLRAEPKPVQQSPLSGQCFGERRGGGKGTNRCHQEQR